MNNPSVDLFMKCKDSWEVNHLNFPCDRNIKVIFSLHITRNIHQVALNSFPFKDINWRTVIPWARTPPSSQIGCCLIDNRLHTTFVCFPNSRQMSLQGSSQCHQEGQSGGPFPVDWIWQLGGQEQPHPPARGCSSGSSHYPAQTLLHWRYWCAHTLHAVSVTVLYCWGFKKINKLQAKKRISRCNKTADIVFWVTWGWRNKSCSETSLSFKFAFGYQTNVALSLI